MKACATGVHTKDATITVRKAGKGQLEYLVITLSDVLVTSVFTSVTAEGDATVENVGLAFGKVDLEYKPQKADGSLEAGVHFTYDLKANKGGSDDGRCAGCAPAVRRKAALRLFAATGGKPRCPLQESPGWKPDAFAVHRALPAARSLLDVTQFWGGAPPGDPGSRRRRRPREPEKAQMELAWSRRGLRHRGACRCR